MADGFSGSPDTFEQDTLGTFTESSFPTGWLDWRMSIEGLSGRPRLKVGPRRLIHRRW